ncbi:MAG TPA: glycerate kinase [Intrasporangium sp.]|uniref:glycerate kinase family protein n=1 Tax=Intrasporangium sp. TaxID=1925024 RepID=UPI002B479F7E|nr:glycerate kinase [Intrasporangium sp.]HKX66642.1 glycerate kinase [Intrasporangium sp.]
MPGVHVLIAPDCFTGTLTAAQAATAMAEGWGRSAPHDTLELVPLSDGGPGFVDVLGANLGGQVHAVTVSDPLGRDVPAMVLVVGDVGYVESAQAAGLHLLTRDERDPTRTTTFGVGQLVQAAIDLGAQRVVIGLGGSGTNDAGAGLLAALGVGTPERLARGGLLLCEANADDVAGLDDARRRLSVIDLVIASDVDSPLLGLKGASAVFSEQKGASPEAAQALESSLSHFASVVARVRPPAKDLLTGTAIRPERQAGAGAAGGLGYALHLLGARQVSGVAAVLEAVGFSERLARSDLVVTGEGSLDWQSLHGKVVVGVADAASHHGVPAIAVPGQSVLGRRDAMSAGISGVYPVVERPAQLEEALADPSGTLATRVVRVARTWSPSPRG